jgi:N-acetylglutamate synthase-like GNAT family acetyltransferase
LNESADSIRSALKSDSIVVARRAGKIVGCVSIRQRPDFAYARRLAVEPAERGCGIGRALMAEAEALTRRLGLSRLRVETRLALTANRAFFRALGFIEGPQHSHPGFAHPTYIELEKTLI